MAGGLFALLDDVAALVRLSAASIDDVAAGASRAGAKTVGVVVDDAAVTPKFVEGVDPKRELPIIRRIAIGSTFNKIVIILPIILLLSQFLPWLLTPLLMIGGTYLCFEGAEKVFEKLGWLEHSENPRTPPGAETEDEAAREKRIVRSAITTDFVLSCEIMVIALNEVAEETLLTRTIILIVVALVITAGVYGLVALIVKMDDIGLHLAGQEKPSSQKFGRALVRSMPRLLAGISVIGTLAMLWVGGYIILEGTNELGFTAIYDLVHAIAAPAAAVAGIGGFLGWLVNTVFSLILGAIWGSIVALIALGITALVKRSGSSAASDHGEAAGPTRDAEAPRQSDTDAQDRPDAQSDTDARTQSDTDARADTDAQARPDSQTQPGPDARTQTDSDAQPGPADPASPQEDSPKDSPTRKRPRK